jgi:hypothetical protein
VIAGCDAFGGDADDVIEMPYIEGVAFWVTALEWTGENVEQA